jgi:hypothetical protein
MAYSEAGILFTQFISSSKIPKHKGRHFPQSTEEDFETLKLCT